MQQEIKCKYCNNKNIIKKGIRKNKLTQIQNYYCRDCKKYFSQTINKTYQAKTVLDAISFYNRGYSLEQTRNTINKIHKTKISKATIQRWTKEAKEYCTINRKKAVKICKPKEMILKKRLDHQQVYIFQYHRAKIELLKELTKLENKAYQKIENYFKRIQTKEFPHHIFETKIKTNQQRGSQIKLELLKTSIKKEKNNANLLALKALTQIKNNYQRHKVIQEFMLYNDTSTIATEIPVYLTKEDIKHYQKNKFKIKTMQTPITGHIDFIQIRNNQIHILDYKPEADKAKPMQQLTFYALALSSRLRLPVKQFKCAWFDENNYYEYSPLKSVYARRNLRTQENL